MRVENAFSVGVPLERVWSYLLDVPAVAPCIPGAELTESVSESEYKGTVTVKLGAVKVSYRGTAIVTEIDPERHRVVIEATGTDARGAGAATATMTSSVEPDGPDCTRVSIVSDVSITGRVAQFGRNIVQDVSNRLIHEFATCLETKLKAGGPADTISEAGQLKSEMEPERGTQSVEANLPTPIAQEHATSSSTPSQSAEIKLLPIVVDVARSRLARGLRRLARTVDSEGDEKNG